VTTPFPPGTYPIPPRATSITIPAPAPVTITAPEPVWGYPAPLAGANAVAWQAVNADAGPLGCDCGLTTHVQIVIEDGGELRHAREYAAHAGAAAGRGPTAPGAAVAAEAGQPSATVHASAVPGHSTPGVGANAVPAPSPGSTQTSAETFRKRYSAALAAKGRHARNQRGRRPAKPVTGYVVPPPERGGAA